MARKKAGPAPEPVEQERLEIGPGDALDLRVGILPDGQWYASLGAPDSDGLCATSAFAFEALRGLAKILKGLAHEDLSAHRVAGEQEMGRCPHVSSDGADCCAIGCRQENVTAVLGALKLAANAGPEVGDEAGRFARDHQEIVRLFGTLKEPALKAKGTEEDVLTATLEVIGDDLTPEYRYLRPGAKKQVVAIIYHADRVSPASITRDHLAQPDLFTSDPEAPPAMVEVLCCPSCLNIFREEGQMPGGKCPFCEFGTLEIRELPVLLCNKCGAPADSTCAQSGDNCPVCNDGQYAIQGGAMSACTDEKKQCEKPEPAEKEEAAEGQAEKAEEKEEAEA